MGYSKKLYIMYWGGVTSIIIAQPIFVVYSHNSQILQKRPWVFGEIAQYLLVHYA